MNLKKIRFSNLFTLALLAVFALGFSSCQSNTKSKTAEEKTAIAPAQKFIGLQLWSVKDDIGTDLPGTVKAVGEIGYGFVEAAGYGDGKVYGTDPVEFKNLCEESGLQFLGSHTGQDVPDEGKWDETMQWWDTCIAAHKAAGVKWIVQPWMGETGYASLDGLKKYCEYFNAVGEKCNAAGIRFGYHNHDKEFSTELEGKPVYTWMLELTDPEKVMFELDLYWIAYGGGDAIEYFGNYPGRFELWHIKDKKEVGASGDMDFAAIFAEREKAGTKYGIVEVEEYDFEPMESCKKSLEFLEAQPYVDFYKN